MKDRRPPGRMWSLYKMGGLTPAITSMFDMQSAQQMAFIRSIMKEQRKNSLYEIPLHSVELVVFDLETTGFSPYNGDEIIAFGAVSVSGEEVQGSETYYSLVNPKRAIPPEIEELTGISNEEAAKAPELLDALRGFLEFVQQKVLVAHGTGHDKHFLNAALWRTSRINLTHRLLDTMMVAKWLNPKLKSYDLDTLLDIYGVEVTRRHHALEDARMTAALWSKLLGEARERDIQTLGDLYMQLSRY
ncbi:DNA polymerase-3 subunit epsilon [Paenibacillus sp. UNCCL117]|uniref:exonuclease domain-containing protein n=1 Tax=unclassified Paenibacillus TaxID=185978 RepID=UPI00087F76E1|nr:MULTISPECIES: exonuclease domain-containing protein [unclassified Paenibacillus]SDC22590.1 DNA polymerase-3 subunit epsilon [Paenibacillus sp. cl123]SFW19074.1 DNA polymerase-3 subunit epsilon [Paenibacillus sp. UNCCL117]